MKNNVSISIGQATNCNFGDNGVVINDSKDINFVRVSDSIEIMKAFQQFKTDIDELTQFKKEQRKLFCEAIEWLYKESVIANKTLEPNNHLTRESFQGILNAIDKCSNEQMEEINQNLSDLKGQPTLTRREFLKTWSIGGMLSTGAVMLADVIPNAFREIYRFVYSNPSSNG